MVRRVGRYDRHDPDRWDRLPSWAREARDDLQRSIESWKQRALKAEMQTSADTSNAVLRNGAREESVVGLGSGYDSRVTFLLAPFFDSNRRYIDYTIDAMVVERKDDEGEIYYVLQIRSNNGGLLIRPIVSNHIEIEAIR